jgi:hypothetical protein
MIQPGTNTKWSRIPTDCNFWFKKLARDVPFGKIEDLFHNPKQIRNFGIFGNFSTGKSTLLRFLTGDPVEYVETSSHRFDLQPNNFCSLLHRSREENIDYLFNIW